MRRTPRGFTLIELLVALAVVAVALAAVQRTTMQAVSNTEAMQIATFAHWIARDRLAEVRVREQWPRAGEQRGQLTFAEREWHWEQTVRTTDDPRLREIEVTVRLDDDPRETVRTRLNTYLMQPQAAPPPPGGTR